MSGAEYFDPAQAGRRARSRGRMNTAALDMRRRRIGESVGTVDHSLADRIAGLGFDAETAAAFDLLPLIHVAWADGKIQRGERALILSVLKVRGFKPGAPAFVAVESLLEERPSDAFFEESLRVLRDALAQRPSAGATVVSLCLQVAEAAGGLFGLRPVSTEERAQIEKVAEALGERAREEFCRRLG